MALRLSKLARVLSAALLIAALAGAIARADEKPLDRVDVFASGEDGYHTYRIPALVVSPAGTLLLFCEGRKSGRSDDGDIDMLLRRSTDGGRTWLPTQIVREEGGDARIKFGNPCALVDRETGTLWLSMNRDYLTEKGARAGGTILLVHSDDDGLTWSEPVDITAAVKKPTWKHYAQGPGIGIQLEHGPHTGRLLISANYRESYSRRDPSFSHVMLSDDHGKTWKLGGISDPNTNECQLVETLEEGRPGLLLNMRNHWGRAGKPELAGKRLVARSSDGGATWSSAVPDAALVESACQASILRYSWNEKGEKSCILFANPAGPGRTHLVVRASFDEGHTWPVHKLVDPGSVAYSCLARLADGRVGLIYESANYGSLSFVSFPLAWLTADE